VFNWIYEVQPLLAIAVFGVTSVVVCWIGILISHRYVTAWVHQEPGLNPTLGDLLQYFGVIYGLLLGLLAVGTYQNHAEAEKAVSSEASALAGLYRDVSGYPEPYRTELRALVREYTRSTIEDAWPLQREGALPEMQVGNPVTEIFTRMSQFEPQTKGQEAIHQTALQQFTTFLESRRTRLYSSTAAIPSVMWYTVALGALVNTIFLCLYNINLRAHLLLSGLISFFTATMICLIAIEDRPFRGQVGVSPEAFELVYEQIMLRF
jgi:hypothetical protein